MHELGPGSTVAGYRLEQVIGRGGMGIVYTAHDDRLDRRVALKLIAPELAADTVLRRRFLDESRVAAGLEHPHVIPVYEAGEADGALYLAMQLVDGDDLRSTLLERGALPHDRAIPIIVQVASALEAAHARGLVHRDVKPSNILLAPVAGGDHAYLSDFGLCKPVEATSGITASGQVVGTVDYMAPEQLRGAHLDGRADIYALGCVTFQCLTGTPPYTGSDVAVMLAHLQQPTPRLPSDPAVDEVLQRALAKAPEDRWSTVGEFASTLREASSSHTRPTLRLPPAAPAPPPTPPAPPARRRRWPAVVAAVVVAVLAAAAAVLWLRGSDSAGGGAALRIQSESALGSRRTVLAGGRGGLYVIRRSSDGGAVNRVDRRSGELMPGVTLDSVPVGLGVSGSAAWVLSVDSTHAGSATLLRVAGASVTPAQPLDGQPGCVDFVQLICNPVVGGGSIWVPVGSFIYRVDASGSGIERRYRLRDAAGQAVYAHGALWALSAHSLVRIDGSSGALTVRPLSGLDPSLDPVQLTLAGSQLWIVCFGSDPVDDALARVPIGNPSFRVATVIHYPSLSAAAGTSTALWATASGDQPQIRRLDPRTGSPQGEPLALPSAVTWAVAYGSDVWLVGFRNGSGARTLLHLVPA